MPLFEITAYSTKLDQTVVRSATEDGSPANFRNQVDAEISAVDWVDRLNETKFAQVDDWVESVVPVIG
jgi:hypothetical protein